MTYVPTTKHLYFVTTTVVEWVDVFTRPQYRQVIIDSLKFCQQHKGLEIYGWVLMTNHLHMLVSTPDGSPVDNIMRDFKKFTSKALLSMVIEDRCGESRRTWMLDVFRRAGESDGKTAGCRFWQRGFYAEVVDTLAFFRQKLSYIHQNPFRAGHVNRPEDYPYSSAIDYMGGKGLIDVIVVR